MIRADRLGGLLGAGMLLALGGCVVPPPAGPSFMALPGKDKTYPEFTRDDGYCRQTAFASVGKQTPGSAAADSGLASTAVGTVIGAVAGTVIGAAVGDPGAGAAIGAGSGLVFGAASGAGAAETSAAVQQSRYDATYAQCMVAYHNLVPVPQPVLAYPVPAYQPVVVGGGVGFGGGW